MKNYFPHDHFARSDKKLINLVRVQGMAGLGLYWCLVEMLYEENGWLNLSDLDNIAYDLRTTNTLLNDLIKDFGLFFINGEKFSSKSVQFRLQIMEEKSSARSKAARKRWADAKENANAMQNACNADAMHMQTTCNADAIKRKEIKLNENKGNETKTDLEADASTTPKNQVLFPEDHPKEKAKEATHTGGAGRKKPAVRFTDAFPTLADFELAFEDSAGSPVDFDYYYQTIGNWAASKDERKIDWKAASRNWLLKDKKEGKLKTNVYHPAGDQPLSQVDKRVRNSAEAMSMYQFDENGNLKQSA